MSGLRASLAALLGPLGQSWGLIPAKSRLAPRVPSVLVGGCQAHRRQPLPHDPPQGLAMTFGLERAITTEAVRFSRTVGRWT